MATQQLFQDLKAGKAFLSEVPYPACGRNDVVIQSRASVISAGTERMLAEFSRASYVQKAKQQPDKVRMVLQKIKTDGVGATWQSISAKLDEPMPVGYCNSGVVLEVGSAVEGLKPGDHVVSNGPHAEVVCVSRNLVAKIPDGVPFEQAAFTVIASIALNGVRVLNPTLGETVAVIGLGLIGQITLDLLKANGVRAVGIDLDPSKVKLARDRGFAALTPDTDPGAISQTANGGTGFDGVIITAASKSSAPVELSAEITRRKGRIVGVGAFGMNLPRVPFYAKELDFRMATSYGPGRYDPMYESRGIDYPIGYVRWTENRNFQAILDLLASGALDFRYLVTKTFGFEQAHAAYDEMVGNRGALGLVLTYASAPIQAQKRIELSQAPIVRAAGQGGVGVIGAGNFSKVVLLPALRKANAPLVAISSAKGATASQAGRKYGMKYTSSDYRQLLADPEIGTIVIATPHTAHAKMTIDALEAGKHVFVEKPLATDLEQLAQIVRTWRQLQQRGKTPRLMVGFNRRFSPFVRRIQAGFQADAAALSMNFIVNAGRIPPEVWVHDPEVGGGRMIGEGCHFIDTMSYVCGSRVKSVTAIAQLQSGGPSALRNDNTLTLLEFENGSIGSLQYCSQGAKQFPKERFVVMGGGKVAELDNFRKLHGFGLAGLSKMGQDKGHQDEISTFLAAARDPSKPDLIAFESLVNTTLATFAHVRSLERRARVEIGELEEELARKL